MTVKHGVRSNVSKKLVNGMFHMVVYALILLEYDVGNKELGT